LESVEYYRQLKFLSRITEEAQKALEESMAMSIDERQELALELYRSRHGMSSTAPSISGTISRRSLGRKSTSAAVAAVLGKTPPR
jgi:protein sidekick